MIKSRKGKLYWFGPVPEGAPVLYRAVARHKGQGGVCIKYDEYVVVDRTDCGYWVADRNYPNLCKLRWMNPTAKARFAWPTKQEALESLIRRTIRRYDMANREYHSTRSIIMHLFVETKHPDLAYMVENGFV